MKKFISILLVLMMLLAFTACDDGKCDTCGEEATENDPKITGVEGEYCVKHLAEEALKGAAEAGQELVEGLIG